MVEKPNNTITFV